MNKGVKSVIYYKLICILILITVVTAASAPVYASQYSRPIGDFRLMELVPDNISPGFPVYATRSDINATSGFTKQEVMATPVGRSIQQTTMSLIKDKPSEYEKVKAIYEWVHKYIEYDDERVLRLAHGDNNSSAQRTFQERKGICGGYNYLTALMLYFAEIPCVDYGGISRRRPDGTTETHAWMAARADGRWIYFDPTWGRFDMPYNYHQNVELIRFTNGYHTAEWVVAARGVTLRIISIIPADARQVVIPSIHANQTVVIYGEPGSYAEQYARRNNILFRAVTTAEFVPDPYPIEPTEPLGIVDQPATIVSLGTIEPPAKNEPPGRTPTAAERVAISPTMSFVIVNGQPTLFEAYNIGGYNYFKLRDLAAALSGTDKQFAVGFDNASLTVTITSGRAYMPIGGELTSSKGTHRTANPTPSKILLDGRELDLMSYNIGGFNFFRLRDIMGALGVAVTYDEATRNIGINAF